MLLPWYTTEALGKYAPGGTGYLDRARPLPVPEADELIKEYCARTGRAYPIPKFDFCIAFAFFRLTVICQGIIARVAMKQASSAKASEAIKFFQPCAEAVLKFVDAGDLSSSSKL
ncbi:hypothetical protein HDV05_005683 [Chytridiales sp. JEL 0842]|nr:hypothetical protein HDV05_005683 [Chytridiales sp. JEL 0842]